MATLFEQLYSASAELLKTAKQPLVKSKLKRQFESARDAALNAYLEASENLQKEREKINKDVDSYDINKVVKYHHDFQSAKRTLEYIETEYKLMFGEDLPKLDDLISESLQTLTVNG